MIEKLSRFVRLRRMGLSWKLAWYCADLPRRNDFRDAIRVFLVVTVASILLLVITSLLDNKYASRSTATLAEVATLRGLLAKCLGEKEGAIFIGGELHLCKAVPTGIYER